MKRLVTAAGLFVMLLGGSAVAQNATETELRDANGAHAGKTVHVGQLNLTIRSDANGHFGAGDMPTLTMLKDVDGRDISIVTDKGDAVADVRIGANGHADRVTLGKGVRIDVVRQGKKGYRQTITGPQGKVLKDHVFDPTRRNPAQGIVLDAVARDLGLTQNWRNEVSIEYHGDSLATVTATNTGKTLLYVVLDGADQVGFDVAGEPVYYEIKADFFSGRMANPEEIADLEPILPDHFVYTRSGQIGAYIRNPASAGIASFWTESDASGATVVKVRGGATADLKPTSHSTGTLSSRARRYLRPGADALYCVLIYVGTYQTCEYYDDGTLIGCSDPMPDYIRSCTDIPSGGGGSTGGGGTGAGPSQIKGNATVYQAVGTGIKSANNKLQSATCQAFLASLTTTTPDPNTPGTPLNDIIKQRTGSTDPVNYLNNYVGFYYGQNKTDASGSGIPCQVGSRYAWTTPSQTSVNVCDRFSQLNATPGMAGDIVIHELLHTLGLPEGGQNQWTNQQITDQVVAACGQ